MEAGILTSSTEITDRIRNIMDKLELKYGCNPNQKPACVYVENGDLPINVLNGKVGYINLLDALNGWQLVRDLKTATGFPAATSFKHVSPAGAAIGLPLSPVQEQMYFVKASTLSPLATAYVRARGADRMSSFGDFIALSDVCDESTAKCINREVSDGVIAPGYTPQALEILSNKKRGAYTVVQIDTSFTPASVERRTVFGVTFKQRRNDIQLNASLLANIVTKRKELTESAVRDLLVAMIALKYTQSNSVCYAYDGQTIGVGAGQQSRIHCTRLAAGKADLWQLRQHPKVLALPYLPVLSRNDKDNVIEQYLSDDAETSVCEDGIWERYFSEKPKTLTHDEKKDWLSKISDVSLASDAFFPFRDNIDRAVRSGVKYISEPGGSLRDDLVIQACDEHGVVMAFTGLRLFHH